MAEYQVRAHLNLFQNELRNAIMHPVTSDPATPDPYQIWFNTTEDRFKIDVNGVIKSLSFTTDAPAGSVADTLWNAQSVVIAISDDTPIALALPEDTVLGRVTGGNVAALTSSNLKAIMSIPAGSLATETYVTNAIDALINGAGAAYDTLQELANEITSNDSQISTILTEQALRTKRYTATIGDGILLLHSVVHNFATEDVVVHARLASDNTPLLLDVRPLSASTVQVSTNVALASNTVKITVIG